MSGIHCLGGDARSLERALEDAGNGYGCHSHVQLMRMASELALTKPERAAVLVDQYLVLRYRGQTAGLSPNELIATHELQLTCLASGRWTVQQFCGAFRNLFLAQPRQLYVPAPARTSDDPVPYRPQTYGSWRRI